MATEAAITSTINGLLADNVVGDASAADWRSSVEALGTLDELSADSGTTTAIATATAGVIDNFHGANGLGAIRTALGGVVTAIAALVVAGGGTADTTTIDAEIASFGLTLRPSPAEQAALLLLILGEVVTWSGTIPAPPPTTVPVGNMKDAAYQTALDQVVTVANDPLDGSYQFAFYDKRFHIAPVYAWLATGDRAYLQQHFDLTDDVITAAAITVPVELPVLETHDDDNGYSNPQINYGAEHLEYAAWEAVPVLWAAEWAASTFEACDMILRSDLATAADIAAAKVHMEWTEKNVIQRYQTSQGSFHAQVAEKTEQMVNGDQDWDDKIMLLASSLCYINYWWPVHGKSLPTFMTKIYPGKTFARQNFKVWIKDLIGDYDVADTGPIYGLTKDTSLSVDGSGYLVIPAAAIDDVGHAMRVPQLVLNALHCGTFDDDPDAKAKLLEISAACDASTLAFLPVETGCVVPKDNLDGTNDGVAPETFNKPIGAWPLLQIGSTLNTNLYVQMLAQVNAGVGGGCWSATMNRFTDVHTHANLSSIGALAAKIAGEGGTKAQQRQKLFLNWE